MANNFLVRYRIITDRGSGVQPDNMIDVFWDDVASAFVVKKIDNILDPSADTLTSGPDLGAHEVDFVIFLGVAPPFTFPKDSLFSFCDGSSLVTFTTKSTFPYITKVKIPNHFSCVSLVCDLQISPFYHWGKASDLITNDGFVEVFASSSNGPIKYSLDPNFNYASQGQTSGLFENLYAGTYTITAKDALGCVDQFTITITVDDGYGVLYRHDFKDVNGIPCRVDILQRGFSGTLTEVDGGADPFIWNMGGQAEQNKFTAVMPMHGVLTLLSPSNFYFRDLFTQDERKHQLKFYMNFGSGLEVKFFGHLISNNGAEPYIKEPYPVQITATDGLADLQNFDFVDRDGNRYREDITALKAITEILAKTDLEINIISAINRFEVNMDQDPADDPLPQCKFDPATFYDGEKVMNCFDALTEVLKPFGGVIKQRLGKWFIFNPEELVAEAAYREFDHEGTYVGNGTIEDIVDIDTSSQAERAVMEGGSQMLELVPAYGKFYFEHTLLKWPSLIKSYSFELPDVYDAPNGLKLFRNWNVNIANNPGTTYGIKATKALEGDYNLFIKYQLPLPGNSADGVVLTASPILIEFESADVFEFRFSYAAIAALVFDSFVSIPWVKVKWMLKVGDYYFTDNGQWTSDTDRKYNDLIVSKFSESLDFKTEGRFPPTLLGVESAQVEFIFTNAHNYDFADVTALKAAPTITRATGASEKVPTAPSFMNYYELEEMDDGDADVDDEIPDDYDETTNQRVWVLKHRNVSTAGIVIEYIYFDNVVLLHFPGGAEPPKDVTILRNNNAGIKVDFEERCLLNDIDITNINNSERTYKNFFKLLDGSPTQEWERMYRPGRGKLLELLSNDVVSQYKTPSNKITGSFLIDREVLPTSILKEVNDGDKKYMFMGYSYNVKHATIAFDIVELKDTVTDDESDDIDAGFSTGFSFGFRS